MILHVD